MERFRVVRRQETVSAISAALEACRCRILKAPDPGSAPFEYEIETPQGERLALVCYAFTANKYRQGGRPPDEHRMQVKYGSDFKRPYELFFDPRHAKITLMFGVHAEEDIFVAVDPTLHSPTWFSSSIEFKDENVSETKRLGWVGWERDREIEGRRRVPSHSFTTEVLLGFTPENFLRYINLERVASGLDPGPRLLAIDRLRGKLRDRHPLELALDLSAAEILDVLNGSFRLLVAVRGSVAERHLETHLRTVRGLSDIRRIDADGEPDFELRYRSRGFRIEVKNVLRRLQTDRKPRIDFQKTRASKADPCSRYYRRDQFDVVAACLHPVTERWDFKFTSTGELPAHSRCVGRIADKLIVETPKWRPKLVDILDALID